MQIDLPDVKTQQATIFKAATLQSIETLKENLKAQVLDSQAFIDETLYPRTHLLREGEGFEPPHPEIVKAYFKHFAQNFKEYNTDAKLAKLLGLSTDRRIRAFKEGSKTVPYGVWRHFLVLTGRVPQDIVKVLAFMA